MGELARSWLYSLLVSGCICSLILFLNTDGKIKGLLETGCACVMLLAFISPFQNLSLQNEMDSYFEKWKTVESNIEFNNITTSQTFMESEYRAYILKEADFYGVELTDVVVSAKQNQEGYWVPVSVIYFAEQPISENFVTHISNDLGLTEERFVINDNS